MSKDFDALLSEIGMGLWQVPVIVTTVLVANQMPSHLIGTSLLAAPVRFHCSRPNATGVWSTSTSYFDNQCLDDEVTELLFEPVNATVQYRHAEPNLRETDLSSCPLIEYDTSVLTSTVISEWDLVCDRVSQQPLFQMIYTIGAIIGSLVCGPLGDRWGRRRAVQIGCVLYTPLLLAMALVPYFPLLLTLRFFLGIVVQCMIQPSFSLALESTPTSYRSLVGMFLGLPYSFSVICMAGISYLVRTWRFTLLISCSLTVILLPMTFIMDESARWLLQNGRREEATAVLQRAMRRNKSKLSAPLESILDKLMQNTKPADPEESESFSFRSSFLKVKEYLSSPTMRTIILVTPLLWFLQSCLYLGVAINANNFNSSNPFLYVCLSGTMDASAILLMTPLTTRLGRRVIVGVGLFAGGVFFLLDLLVPLEYFWLKWLLVMGGFLLVAGSFQLNYVYGPELFPTEVRNRGFAFVNFMGSLGFVFSPLITYNLALIAWWVAPVTFGSAAILSSFTLPLLPETRNRPMPDTLKAVEDMMKRQKSSLKSADIEEESQV